MPTQTIIDVLKANGFSASDFTSISEMMAAYRKLLSSSSSSSGATS